MFFQANDAYGSSNGDIFKESWYNQFDALSGMEYFILATKLHAGSEEPMTPKSTLTQYAGSNFWSSKVCEGGESRGAYACRLTFDPSKFLIEINDHMSQFFSKTHFWSTSN